jgi:hypothetical protein
MSKNIERCPKDVKKLVNPKTGRCVMESSPIIKKLISEGYTILITPNPNQPEPSPKSKNNDVKVFKICPTDSNKLVNPTTGRCIMQTSPIIKKLMAQGWSIGFNDPGVTPLVIKPKGVIDLDKLKKDLDIDKDGIVSINEYLSSFEITPVEEEETKGAFAFLRTNTNIPRFLALIRETDPVFKKNLCWFNQKFYAYTKPKGAGPKIKITSTFSTQDFNNYNVHDMMNHAQLYNAPISRDRNTLPVNFIIHPGLKQQVKTCKERYLAMALSLAASPWGAEFYSGGHANVLIFDTISKTVDRYDPHGTQCDGYACPAYDQDGIDAILKKEFKKILPDYKFIDLSVACPNVGPQTKAEIFDRTGYCVTWSLMFTVLRILNPGKSPEEVNNQLLDGTRAEIFSKMLKFAKFYSDVLKNNEKYTMETA